MPVPRADGSEMDTFTDRLTQRLNAQEIIKANSAAEVEKMQKLQNEVRDYQECVAQMRIMNGEIQRAVDKLAQIVGGMTSGGEAPQLNMEELKAALDTVTGEKLPELLDTFRTDISGKLDTLLNSQFSEKLDGILPKIEEAVNRNDADQNLSAQMQKMLEEITAKLDGISQNETGLEEQKRLIQETQEKLEDHIHKENVKVYRNVQAVIMEESTKQTEAVADVLKKVTGKVKATVGISITALILSFLSLGGIAYLILTQLNIL
jgi:Skp family chaperone for outer membrane proteins